MSFRRSKGAVLVALDALQFPATVADADDLLADGDGIAPFGSSVLDLGTIGGWASGTKPVAIAVKATDHPADHARVFVGGSTYSVTITSTPVLGGGTTPPSLQLPDDMTIEATGPTGALVTYEATAPDPPSGGSPLLASLVPVTSSPVPGIPSSNDKVVPRGRTVPLRFRLAGDEPSGFDTAGWQILRLQVDCADPDSMIASSLALRDQAQAAGRPDRPQQADQPARGSRGSQDRGTKGGRSER